MADLVVALIPNLLMASLICSGTMTWMRVYA
jgi:hypothetical protein